MSQCPEGSQTAFGGLGPFQPSGPQVPPRGFWAGGPGFVLLASATQWVPRPSRSSLRRAGTTKAAGAKLRNPIPERNHGPSLIHAYQPGLFAKIETITASAPCSGVSTSPRFTGLRCVYPEFLHALLGRPYIEVMRGNRGHTGRSPIFNYVCRAAIKKQLDERTREP
jgi:hypothetical protein